MQPNYFTCTLGQAATLNEKPKPYNTIGEFLAYQGVHCKDVAAVGFPVPNRNDAKWSHRVLRFGDVDKGTNSFADRLSKSYESLNDGPQTVALLCHSSPEFLFTWLSLIKMGHSVLLIAPQCQAVAVAHLCQSCNARLLLHDSAHLDRAQEAVRSTKSNSSMNFACEIIPLKEEEDIFDFIDCPSGFCGDYSNIDPSSVAYLHHTSGTSSGLPKPIPQSHRAAIGVLPHLPESPSKATFTTTPLYHGGIADLFRSWTSDSMIWLFPGNDAPITARNIRLCLEEAEAALFPNVRFFSSVPYVLQMMASDETGLGFLKRMEITGVGGAALPTGVGNILVDAGVNLISRFGSAECGFILSSFRDFSIDKEWRYLRNSNPASLLDFEGRDDGLSELVVKREWPHMAKKNREDESFASADLFAPHPTIQGAWLYHSRADSQLTLITGKKFDPAPLEDAIATSPLLDDVLIFGDNRAFPGALLLRSEQFKQAPDQEILDSIRPVVEKINSESQDHARIPGNMLIPVPFQDRRLEKSSKGTIVRRAAIERFQDYISQAYETQDRQDVGHIEDQDVARFLTDAVYSITLNSAKLERDMDLFSYGVDSIVSMQLRNRLQKLIPGGKNDLPLSIVEDTGSIQVLADYVIKRRHGEDPLKNIDEEQLMMDLVDEFSQFQKMEPHPLEAPHVTQKTTRSVVLTGATGALGAHVLDLLRASNQISTIYCLVRGTDSNATKERVGKALEQRGLGCLSSDEPTNSKIKILQAQLGEPRLGLTDEMYDQLATEADLILHIAWTVNFRLKLRSFVKDNIAGVRNLIDLATANARAHPPHFAYCSSTAAILNTKLCQSEELPERILHEPSSASPLGYSRSKWVAEQICLRAHERTSLRGRVSVIRVGQLSGDSRSGVWNTKEAYPMMLSTAKLVGCLPDLDDEPLDWLPVDIAASSLLQATQYDGKDERIHVYHVLNPHHHPQWKQMLRWLGEDGNFDVVLPQVWISRLEECDDTEHSALKLLGLWKEAYGNATPEKPPRPKFSLRETKGKVPAMNDIRPVDKAYMRKIWDWVLEHVR
ncbi:hypothetical protein BS50DRAFT_655177 [Corynespora cassiicola Philippines]|uniref:Carrier domain-containing protein n=1 Tax=Corynespora cassiicola Philippines TaxID=1448308 RepID=A0A2T2N592_CORCC|nr:hypothetical protein BS50DRAFT_655177 [Corynespora cassiicola Philippines]